MHFQENDFYTVLTSNTPVPWTSDHNNGEQNRISQFYTALPHQKYFGAKKWEVALIHISYPHTWLNVEGDKHFLEFDSTIDDSTTNDEVKPKRKIILPEAHYDSGEEIIEQINKLLEKNELKSRFIFHEFSNKVTVATKNNERLKLSPLLSSTLGLYPNWNYEHNTRHGEEGYAYPGVNSVDLDLTTHNLFVYSDIIEQTILGGHYHPLLAIIPTRNADYNSYVTERFTTPQYIPLNTNILNGIKITIKDDQDELIRFNAGRVLLSLHFRKK